MRDQVNGVEIDKDELAETEHKVEKKKVKKKKK